MVSKLPSLTSFLNTYKEADTFLTAVEYAVHLENFCNKIVHALFYALNSFCKLALRGRGRMRLQGRPPTYAAKVATLLENINLSHQKAELGKALSKVPVGEPVGQLHRRLLQAFRRYGPTA